MNKVKRAKLESNGWVVGDAQEFLGLSDAEARFIALKLALSAALRERRTRAKLSQAEFASRIGSSQSRVAKMEAGDPSVSVDLLVRSLLHFGVTSDELAGAISSKAA
jgi:DNA-binding XRE family transcriptional regulator